MMRATRDPASVTATATRKASCIPATKVAWLTAVIAAAADDGVLADTGAAPTDTADFAAASCAALSAGRWAACHAAGSRLLILDARTAPRTDVPMAPPTWYEVDWRPPATPASSTGALPTMTLLAPTITGARPAPSRKNQTMVLSALEPTVSRDRP